ncbi:ADP-ribose pyrophosphatase YjhB (NUDIX family) [Ensifer mexicanus]|nr:NUDIX domain-containing protein [Sinorhizobium mexicanum]MBP1881891.1 ADP-ribose pyrophosphatase YjhB (NUDIX family) [Sinorhizobium mexicanum]
MRQKAPDFESNNSNEPEEIEQAGAICIRRSKTARPEVLLVGSRRNGRWGLPKDHIEDDEDSKSAAERGAFEEAHHRLG